MSKGSNRRPGKPDAYQKGWDKVFGDRPVVTKVNKKTGEIWFDGAENSDHTKSCKCSDCKSHRNRMDWIRKARK